jgi:serine/threonine protein kinase
MPGHGSLIGQTVSHYRVLLKLGEGGMGVVYRAVDERLRRDVALKFLPETIARDERALYRFQREAEAASKLNHPNICTIYEIAEDGGRVFIAMELVFGRTLKNYMSGPLLSITETIDIAIQIADALEAAHEGGVIHRDIKPANIMITMRGLAKILDFGLAKIQPDNNATIWTSNDGLRTAEPEGLTRVGSLVGTTAYMSPEQARGEELDNRTDVFSFGVLLYEMSTGSLPFGGANAVAVLHAIMEEVPRRPTQINPDVPPELERIINKTLKKDRALRYQRASEIRSDLQRLKGDSDLRRVDDNSTDKDPIVKSRVLEAAAPKQSLVGRATEILTVIRLPNSEGLREYIKEEQLESLTRDDVREKPFFLKFCRDMNGKPQPAEVILKVDSPDFEPRSQSKKLKVPPRHDSEICTFLLTPLLVGELVVNIELLVGDEIVVSRSIRTKAEPEGISISFEKVLVCVRLPLAMLVLLDDSISLPGEVVESGSFVTPERREAANQEVLARLEAEKGKTSKEPLASGSVLPPAPKSIPTRLPLPVSGRNIGRIAAVFGVLALVVVAIFSPLRRQTGKPADSRTAGKTLGEVKASPTAFGYIFAQFSTAFSHKSISELQAIWPHMGDEKEFIEREFDSAQEISRTFDIKSSTVSPDEQMVTFTGVYHDTIRANGKTAERQGNFSLRLVNANGRWLIEEAKFVPR